MRLLIIGLGRMGGNMAARLLRAGHDVVGYNRSYEAADELARTENLIPAATVAEAVTLLSLPRVVWLMVPAGDVTEDILQDVLLYLSPGDIVIDGGNANFNDSIRRGKALKEKGIHFLDVGVSGGIWGLTEGYSLMIGGDPDVAQSLGPIFASLAPGAELGWGWVGPNGAGHFVKMVHNGIEYGMMEAFAEGFELMRARQDLSIDLYGVSQIWRHGSVVRSWLLDLFGNALEDDPDLPNILDWVADSGEGRWAVTEAIRAGVSAPVIALSLFRRFESQQPESYANKLLAAVRNQFGGHPIMKKESGSSHE